MANASGFFSTSVPSLKVRIKPSIGVIGSGFCPNDVISKRVLCSSTVDGADKLSPSQSRMPIDTVHAGAAIHCWPSPTLAVAEVSRVLRPGGVFVATTFILDGPFSFVPFLRPISQNLSEISGSNTFLSEREIEDLCAACGLVDFKCIRNRQFVMFSASKPS